MKGNVVSEVVGWISSAGKRRVTDPCFPDTVEPLHASLCPSAITPGRCVTGLRNGSVLRRASLMGSPESRYPPAWVGVGDSVGGDAMRHGVNGVATLVAWNAGGPAFAQISRCMDSPPGWGG